MAISTGDTPDAVETFRRETGMEYPIYLDDGQAARAFAVQASPTCILVAPDGTIRYRGPKPPENRS